MDDGIAKIEERLKQMAEHGKRFDDSMKGSELSIRRLVTSFVGAHIAEKILNVALAQSTTVTTMKNGFNALQQSVLSLNSQQIKQDKMLNSNLREQSALRGIASKEYLDRLKQESRELLGQLRVTQAQINLKQALTRFGVAEAFAATMMINGVQELYHTHKLINASLIEANSDMQTRIGLTKAVIRTQQQLGSEIGITRDAARELVHYGYDLDATFKDNLKLVVQLHDGLGMSVTQGAELVAVFDRQLKMPVRDVANAISRVVNDTSLAADQAGRLAVNIGRAVAALRPGMHSDLAAVTELLGRYEGALQSLGGQVGQFGDLLARMTTPEGMMQAGILGITDPRFLESDKATKRVIDSFASYAKSVLGDSRGWDRALRLQVIAEQFGTTAQQVNLMVEAVEKANSQRSSSLTLEQRYREQIRASGESFERIGRSLRMLVQNAAVPLLEIITPIAGGLASMAEAVVQSKVAIYGVTGLLIVALPIVALKTWNAVAAFAALGTQLMFSARAARMRMVSDAAQMSLPGIGGAATPGAVVATTLPKIVRILGGVFGVLAAFTAGYSLGTWLEKKYSHIDPKFVSELRRSYDDTLKMSLQRYVANGDIEGVRHALANARSVYGRRFKNSADIEAKMANAMQGLVEAFGTARFRKEISESSIERDPANVKAVAELAQAQTEMIDIASQQREAAMKQIELQKQQNNQSKEQTEEDRRNRRLMQWKSAPGFFLKEAYDFYTK